MDSIKNKPAHEDRIINLQTDKGTYLKVDGYATINFRVSRLAAKHRFVFIRNLTGNIILSSDLLQENGAGIC